MNKLIRAFILPLTIISIFSLSTIWSTTPDLFLNQLIYLLISILLSIIVSKIDIQYLNTLIYPVYFLIIFLLIITPLVGNITRGSVRWISIGGLKLQASELAKPALILFFANTFNQPILKPFSWLVRQILFIFPPLLLIFLQPDLGSTIIIFLIFASMLIASNFPTKKLLLVFSIGLFTVPIILSLLQPYQRDRITSFLNPYSDPQGSGYNVIQSLIAVGSGRFLGKGIRQGTQSQLEFLPEKHTDFAFASFAEEFGFLGTSFLLLAISSIMFWLIHLFSSPSPTARLIAVGVFAMFASQTFINIGMNLGMMPVTGITLPLFSYGGSSLLSFGLAFGFLLSANKKSE